MRKICSTFFFFNVKRKLREGKRDSERGDGFPISAKTALYAKVALVQSAFCLQILLLRTVLLERCLALSPYSSLSCIGCQKRNWLTDIRGRKTPTLMEWKKMEKERKNGKSWVNMKRKMGNMLFNVRSSLPLSSWRSPPLLSANAFEVMSGSW